ncbi:MAG: hypothetical protein U5R31_01765 [Acidimicrobiia bacterium]|nr:hypothetical protein [Acidimicrobiia bacterium]
MSFLHEGIDRLQAEDAVALPEGRLDDDVVELSRAIDRLQAERLRRLRRWEASGVWAQDGSRCGAGARSPKDRGGDGIGGPRPEAGSSARRGSRHRGGVRGG